MKIGIIGSGSMGANMGRIWANCGHQILFSYSRDENKLKKLAEAAGNNAKTGTPSEAVAFGDVILLSVPWASVSNALHTAGAIEDKVLFSCVNALKPDMSGLEIGTTTSAAEEIAKLAPKAKVVEALPPFAEILASDSRRIASQQPTVFYCGDDAEAKSTVAKLLEELDLEAVDAGELTSARYIEPSGFLTVQLGYGMKMGTNTMVHKPASATPLSAIKLAEIFEMAGLPKGVYNLVIGPGSVVGDAMVTHPAINKVSFTGSTQVGQNIIRQSAETVKKLTMELGGKSANIVFADADIEATIQNVFFGIFYNKGEICTAGSRLLVERSVYDEVVEGLINYLGTIKMGNPLDPEVVFGPMADAGQLKKMEEYVEIGKADGATLRFGGDRFYPEDSNGKGYYFQPTIFTNANNEMRIAQEEIFGPILTVIPFETESEAIQIANGTPYGLASGVHTRDIKKAMRVASAMEAGTCWVNTYNMFEPSVPFGGVKMSGYGRECGPEVMEAYTHTKSIWVNLS